MYKKAVLKRALKDVEIEVPVEYQNAYMNTEQIDNSNYELDFEDKKKVVKYKRENLITTLYICCKTWCNDYKLSYEFFIPLNTSTHL